MTTRELARQERHEAEFILYLSWQDSRGQIRRVNARCVDLSQSGVCLETLDALTPGTNVMVNSECFGRMGNAMVRYCRREGMKYVIGLQFGAAFALSEPVRKRMLEQVQNG